MNVHQPSVLELQLAASIEHLRGEVERRDRYFDQIEQRGVIVPRPAKEKP